jgi:hypothetical protein
MKKAFIILMIIAGPFLFFSLLVGSEDKTTEPGGAERKVNYYLSGTNSSLSSQIEERWIKAMRNWRVHDMKRPQPEKVDPGTFSGMELPAKPPSDAIILFDGKDLSKWEGVRGGEAKWLVRDGYFEVVQGTGDIRTIQSFGDCQLHIEWKSPVQSEGKKYDGNSGIFMMSKYEVQIFDSYGSGVYADGNAGSIYGEYPPDVNVCLPPGDWQVFDIIFHRPHFDNKGDLVKPAIITVLHNGVVVQAGTEILGPTGWMSEGSYKEHANEMPLSLQDHGNPVCFRNVWIRPLPREKQDWGPDLKEAVTLTGAVKAQLVGVYGKGTPITLELREGILWAKVASLPFFELISQSENELTGIRVDSRFTIDRDEKQMIKGLTWYRGSTSTYCIKLK